MIVGSAFNLDTFVTSVGTVGVLLSFATACTIFATSNFFATGMTHALWLVAFVSGLVTELTYTAISGRGTFNGETTLLFTFVWSSWIREETFAVCMVTAFNLYTDGISAKFL